MSEKILVIGELQQGVLRQVSYETIAAAKQVDADAEIVALVMGGGNLQQPAEEMIRYGADRAITVAHANLNNYTSEAYGQVILEVMQKENPSGVMMGHTSVGKDVTPKIAGRLELGLISDAVAIEKEDGNIMFTRPIYSGKAFEKKVITDEGLLFATIRPNNIPALEYNPNRTGEVSALELDVKDLRTIVKEVIRRKNEGVDLSEAKVVIAGGRGVKGAEGFQALYELADLLGGAVGASRGACDADYCDYSLQIGQTGKVVTPDLYIAVGISGAIQHMAGMSNSKVIVAINSDAEANIFNIADYGIVGDLFEVLPLLIEELKLEGAVIQ
ncbi:electron transfer flavoprotein subunit alpha [Sporosarcina sp. P37]|uniref:electron transfer flavoprotein subunit alpha/FixB family protein n=1 Tax=unclassified Sporosarcina TaxID=2647733 RepID=UPI000A1799DA|nr:MULTISPECIES: electron transfer flavoprotein subunit alpha/FixB family protein [unclassified Sporosarcina]ARK23444.1 electron transfer flavoprotein subunit alpha [Sporosarcina sp. P37]PID18654.1 electron transfer flavoprotein subunit alpha/FixB family protein [Sporosarcina sp. P35]